RFSLRAFMSLLRFLLMSRRPPGSTLFPYTTLFRSQAVHAQAIGDGCIDLEGFAGNPAALFRPERPQGAHVVQTVGELDQDHPDVDRKSTRLNSSHVKISYAVFCLKKKKNKENTDTI